MNELLNITRTLWWIFYDAVKRRSAAEKEAREWLTAQYAERLESWNNATRELER
jgi:hypothetical protein